MLNNQSITPVDTEEKQASVVKGFENESQEHSEAKTKKQIEPLTKLSVNNLVKSSQVVTEVDAIKVTDNGTAPSAKVNKAFINSHHLLLLLSAAEGQRPRSYCCTLTVISCCCCTQTVISCCCCTPTVIIC